MHADLDDLLTALYVLVDDFLPARTGAGRRNRTGHSRWVALGPLAGDNVVRRQTEVGRRGATALRFQLRPMHECERQLGSASRTRRGPISLCSLSVSSVRLSLCSLWLSLLGRIHGGGRCRRRLGMGRWLGLALAIAALAVAGCGGGSSSSKSSNSSSAPAATSTGSSSGGSSSSGIPQGPNAGDKDSDNQGGPSDGDGNI